MTIPSRLAAVNLIDLVGAVLMAVGLLTCILLLVAVVLAVAKSIPLATSEARLDRNLRRQQRLYATYAEWRKAQEAKNPGGDILSFDQWKEATNQ